MDNRNVLYWPQLAQSQNNLHIHGHFDVPGVSQAYCKQTCIPDVKFSVFVLNTLETFSGLSQLK